MPAFLMTVPGLPEPDGLLRFLASADGLEMVDDHRVMPGRQYHLRVAGEAGTTVEFRVSSAPEPRTFTLWPLTTAPQGLRLHALQRLFDQLRTARSRGAHGDYRYRIELDDFAMPGFDSAAPRLRIRNGTLVAELDSFLLERLGGDLVWHPAGATHSIELNGDRTIVDYWWNEQFYQGPGNRTLLLPDDADTALVVTTRCSTPEMSRLRLQRVVSELTTFDRPSPEIARGTHSSDQSAQDVLDKLRGHFPEGRRPLETPFSRSDGTGVDDGQIHEAESQLGVRLPESYKQLLRENNGGWFRYQLRETHDRYPLKGLGRNQGGPPLDQPLEGFFDGVVAPDLWKPRRPLSLLVPIMSGAYDAVCLDYRLSGPTGDPEVSIVIWGEDEIRLAHSFEAMLGLLSSDSLQLGIRFAGPIDALATLLAKHLEHSTLDRLIVLGESATISARSELNDVPEFSDAEYLASVWKPEDALRIVPVLAELGLLVPALLDVEWLP